jgi:3-hydroxyacyl-[acyl-carrier-protein] dehydratase
MPPPPILDPTQLALARLIADQAAIQEVLPHRHEFLLLNGVVHVDRDRGIFAGYHDVTEDAFWVRGHIPGRPLFPGVLMIEVAAQLSSYIHHSVYQNVGFLGFTGVDEVKFRGTIQPPARFVVIGRVVKLSPRRVVSDAQGFVENAMVFEGRITGMTV